MAGQSMITVGGSAGAIEALGKLLKELPTDFAAPLCAVVHLAPGSPSVLAKILGRASNLPVLSAEQGQSVQGGHVYIAVPDHHMVLEDHHLLLNRGPQINRSRPAIDPLFESAANAYDSHAIGILLSGLLDDGTVGLLRIKERGGIAIVQDPADAMFDGMLRSAMKFVKVDYVVPVAEMPALLSQLLREPAAGKDVQVAAPPPFGEKIHTDIRSVEQNRQIQGPSLFPCPGCGGATWEQHVGDATVFQCRVGHIYTMRNMLAAQASSLEQQLWVTVQYLESRASLCKQFATHLRSSGQAEEADRYDKEGDWNTQQADQIRGIITSGPPLGFGGTETGVEG